MPDDSALMRVLLIASPAGAPPDLAHADALVLDHAPAAEPAWLPPLRRRPGALPLYVRVAPSAADLAAALALRPDGIVLPGVADAGDVARLGVRLSVHEAETGIPDGATRIVAGLDGTGALLRFGGGSERFARLAGLFCAFDALARDLGVSASSRAPQPAPLAQARGLLVLAAAALRVPAFDMPGPSPDRATVEAACRDGFRGGFAETAAAAAVLAAVFGRDPSVAGGPRGALPLG